MSFLQEAIIKKRIMINSAPQMIGKMILLLTPKTSLKVVPVSSLLFPPYIIVYLSPNKFIFIEKINIIILTSNRHITYRIYL